MWDVIDLTHCSTDLASRDLLLSAPTAQVVAAGIGNCVYVNLCTYERLLRRKRLKSVDQASEEDVTLE